MDTGEVPSRKAKVRDLPEPTTKLSPQREPATAASEVDTSKQGRDTRAHSRGQPEPTTTPTEVDTSKQGRDTRAHGRGQQKTPKTDSEANRPGLSKPQSKAPARDQPPDRGAKTTKGDHAAHGKGGRGG